MYTDCPGCHRQFHVYAAQLSAAGGLVKCGFCGQKFNALERLRDKPLARPIPEPPILGPGEPSAEPEFVIPGRAEEGRVEEEQVEEEQIEERIESDMPEDEEVSHEVEKAVVVESSRRETGRQAAVPASTPRPDNFRYTEELLEQPVQKSGWISRLLWGFGILLLTTFAASQIIWFNRDAIMGRYPVTISWFNRLCQKLDCEIIRHRDPGSIELLNRDVRDHPRYKNALLVNATMINRSQTVQAYPVVQLNLFDVDGKLIAYRRFQPDEYLDDSIDILRGMAPNVPVHFVLEVMDSAKGAVSFEFEFH